MSDKSKHELLCEAAEEAINAVHGDDSVSREQTHTSLEELVEHTEVCISAVATDIRNSDSTGDSGEDR
jgi:hypothetical protein